MAKEIEVLVPDIGDFDEVEIVEVLVSVGDRVEPEDGLVTLESDKATMEIPAPQGGVVQALKVGLSDKVSEGSLILILSVDEAAASEEAPAQTPAPAAQVEAPRAAVPAAAAPRDVDVLVPDIGDFDEVEIIEVLVAKGDRVEAEQSLVTLESDKASMEVPSPHAGVVKEVSVALEDKVSEGSLLVVLTVEAEAATDAPAAAASASEAPVAAAAATPREAPLPPQPAREGVLPHASPMVRGFARELGVDLSQTGASGPHRRILIDDVKAHVRDTMSGGARGGSGIPPIPAIDFSKFGEIEVQPLTKIKKVSGASLSRSWLNLPHVTQHDEADITELEAFRKSRRADAEERGVKLTLLLFLMKASVQALRRYPEFCASLDPSGENLILKKYAHVGIAVDTEQGLVVPVVRDVDKKGLFELAAEVGELAEKARARKLSPSDMSGACFTISSLGGIGGTAFTPIVNAPEVAILGVSRSARKPVWSGAAGEGEGGFVPRLILPFSLSYDHRVIDGAAAARFTTHLAKLLSDVANLLL